MQFLKSSFFWIFLLSGFTASILLIIFVLFMLVRAGHFGPVPDIDELSQIRLDNSTEIYSADGVLIGRFPSHRTTTLTLDEINPELIDALLAIEDVRFYHHNGIDLRALGRVFVRTLLLRQNAGGGSTITQQLVKNIYPRFGSGGVKLITDKIREMIIAHRLESIFTKDEILQFYLNSVSFGEDTVGIYSASYRFFNKHPFDLSLTESATLAGVLRATTYYNPFRNNERSIQRRNIVLRQMQRYGKITDDQAEEAIQEPLLTDYIRRAAHHETAPFFLNYVNDQVRYIFQNIPALDGREYHIESDEVIIHTTLNSRLQNAAEEAVRLQLSQLQGAFDRELESHPVFFDRNDPDVLSAWRSTGHYSSLRSEGYSNENIEQVLYTPVTRSLFTWDGYQETKISPYDELRKYLSFLNAGFIALDPSDGSILAWVGGIDPRHFPYDQVMAKRQPGSAFKPIVYAAALENGREPCDYQRNQLTTFASYDDWTPRNHQEEYGGYFSLQGALSRSINTATVHLARETGLHQIRQTANSLGVQTDLIDTPSLALGTSELSLLELTASYTAFLNLGLPVKPFAINKIYNSEGDLIYDFTHSDNIDQIVDQNAAISEETAKAMVVMLEKAMSEGTGRNLRSQFGINHAIAGKTGTTQNFVDGWFVGFTPEIVFGTRIGGYNHRVRFRHSTAFASQTALPLAGHFLNQISADTAISNSSSTFPIYIYDLPFDVSCPDYREDGFRDRLRNFFSGRNSDDPVVVDDSIEDGEKDRNIFRRLGRRLGISDN